jgi:hypothetical protein
MCILSLLAAARRCQGKRQTAPCCATVARSLACARLLEKVLHLKGNASHFLQVLHLFEVSESPPKTYGIYMNPPKCTKILLTSDYATFLKRQITTGVWAASEAQAADPSRFPQFVRSDLTCHSSGVHPRQAMFQPHGVVQTTYSRRAK